MNIFIKQKTFLIDKIEKVDDGWNIRVKEKDVKPIHVSNHYYTGKMPPKFCFPWHKRKLHVLMVDDFVISAKIDDISLFTIDFNDYPEKIRERLLQGEEIVKKVNHQMAEEDNVVRQSLAKYISNFPVDKKLESKISQLHVCWRVYLKLHLLKDVRTKDKRRAICLMYKLIKIAELVYFRHVNVRKSEKENSMEVTFAPFILDVKTNLWVNHHCPIESILNYIGTDTEIYGFLFEIDRLIDDQLPPVENSFLKNYLNFVVRKVLNLFAQDYATLQRFYATDAWYKRIKSDEEDYKDNYQQMSLLKYGSFILPRVFSDEEIQSFMHNYSLY